MASNKQKEGITYLVDSERFEASVTYYKPSYFFSKLPNFRQGLKRV